MNFLHLVNLAIENRREDFEPIKRSGSVIEDANVPDRIKRRILESKKNEFWLKPNYDFDEIEIASDADSLLSRSIQKKADKFLVAGYEIVGRREDLVQYIKQKIRVMSYATSQSFQDLLLETFVNIIKNMNCFWHRIRKLDLKSNEKKTFGFFVVPIHGEFECLSDSSGTLKAIRRTYNEDTITIKSEDFIHFYKNKKTGVPLGTPDLNAVIEDIKLLRRIEENVEDLIEKHLFPIYHFRIGNDQLPEVVGPDGVAESVRFQSILEKSPTNGFLVTDHRYESDVLGSGSSALDIEVYLKYFYKRVLVGLGVSEIDLGSGDTANRSTASTLSKGLMTDIAAVQKIMKDKIESIVFIELLLEAGFDVFNIPEADLPRIKFGQIDIDEKIALENHYLQTFSHNAMTHDELRIELGREVWSDEDFQRSWYTLFSEPGNLIKGLGPDTAAAHTLAGLPQSNIEPKAVAKEAATAKAAAAKAQSNIAKGRPVTKSSQTVKNKNQPQNQHGTRSGPKLTSDRESLIADSNKIKFLEEKRKIEQLIDDRIDLIGEEYANAILDTMSYRYERLLLEYGV